MRRSALTVGPCGSTGAALAAWPPARVTAAQPHSGTNRWLEPERLPDHLDRLLRAACALSRSREHAQDLVQETYERVLRRPRLVRRGGELAYLMRVLRNVWLETVAASARRPIDPTPIDELDFMADRRADPEVLLEARAAYSAIGELSPVLRETIAAVDLAGLSLAGAVRSLRRRGHRARAPPPGAPGAGGS